MELRPRHRQRVGLRVLEAVDEIHPRVPEQLAEVPGDLRRSCLVLPVHEEHAPLGLVRQHIEDALPVGARQPRFLLGCRRPHHVLPRGDAHAGQVRVGPQERRHAAAEIVGRRRVFPVRREPTRGIDAVGEHVPRHEREPHVARATVPQHLAPERHLLLDRHAEQRLGAPEDLRPVEPHGLQRVELRPRRGRTPHVRQRHVRVFRHPHERRKRMQAPQRDEIEPLPRQPVDQLAPERQVPHRRDVLLRRVRRIRVARRPDVEGHIELHATHPQVRRPLQVLHGRRSAQPDGLRHLHGTVHRPGRIRTLDPDLARGSATTHAHPKALGRASPGHRQHDARLPGPSAQGRLELGRAELHRPAVARVLHRGAVEPRRRQRRHRRRQHHPPALEHGGRLSHAQTEARHPPQGQKRGLQALPGDGPGDRARHRTAQSGSGTWASFMYRIAWETRSFRAAARSFVSPTSASRS